MPSNPKNDSVVKEKVQYYTGVGRRKRAIAAVRLSSGSGKFILNEQEVDADQEYNRVLESVDLLGKVDLSAHVHGGGKEGQKSAIRHGLSRALLKMNDELKATLKKSGLLTRDSREKERKKYGLHGARRGHQFSKR